MDGNCRTFYVHDTASDDRVIEWAEKDTAFNGYNIPEAAYIVQDQQLKICCIKLDLY